MNTFYNSLLTSFRRTLSLMFFAVLTLHAKGGVDIGALIEPSFPKGSVILKKQFKLTPQQSIALQEEAKAKMDSNVVRLYSVKLGQKTQGYAVLLLKKIRTKSAAVLYIMDTRHTIQSIEVVAFGEPSEYRPNKVWQKSFEGKTQTDNLFAGKGIPTISGATLSARAISDAARLAIAIARHYTL